MQAEQTRHLPLLERGGSSSVPDPPRGHPAAATPPAALTASAAMPFSILPVSNSYQPRDNAKRQLHSPSPLQLPCPSPAFPSALPAAP